MLAPRPYQQEALDALHRHICRKDNNPCIVFPTGSGKSLMIAWSIGRWRTSYPKFRAIVLAHRRELVRQNADEFYRSYFGEDNFSLSSEIGIFSAALGRRDRFAPITFASIDSVYRRSGEFPPFDVIMVDEAHRIPMSGEGKYLTFLKGCKRFNPRLRVIGWTATPFRMGSGPICHKDHLLNEVCYEAKVPDLIAQGYLCGLRSKVGTVVPDLNDVRESRGEYVTSSLAKKTNKQDIIEGAIREAVVIIKAENRRSIVFFCVDIEHCHAVSRELSRYGINAPPVTSKTKSEIRNRIGRDFKDGKLNAVCNVNVYTEGFNATCIDCIALLRPTLSAGLFSQMVGRGLRLHSNKRDCLVLDFAHCIEEHGPVDLLGDKRVAMATCAKCRESFSRAIRKCPACDWEIPKLEMERLEAEERERRMHSDKPSRREILSGVPETFKVDGVMISRHRKKGSELLPSASPDSLLVRYRCGLKIFREWICLDHEGYAGQKAQAWWVRRLGRQRRLVTVNDALEDMLVAPAINEWTQTITVRKEGKYNRIIDYNRNPT